MKGVVTALGLAVGLLSTGCATMFSGTTQHVFISTSPVEANLTIRYGNALVYRGPSPWNGRLRKRYPITIEARAEGYHTYAVQLARRTCGWYRLNYLLLGLMNGIDQKSGAAWVIVRPKLNIKMQQTAPPPVPPDLVHKEDPVEEKPPPEEGEGGITDSDVLDEDDYDE